MRLKALYIKHYNNTQPNLIIHYISHSIYEEQISTLIALIFSDDTEKSACVRRKYEYTVGQNASKAIDYLYLSPFKQPKRRIKMTALMLPLPSEAAIEEKTNTCTDRRHPTSH